MDTVIIPILNMYKLRAREVRELMEGHTAGYCQKQNSSVQHCGLACISES